MLDIRIIRENPDEVQRKLDRRGAGHDLKPALEADKKRLSLIKLTEEAQRDKNALNKQIGQKRKAGENADEEQAKSKELSARLKTMESDLKEAETRINDLLLAIPNTPDDSIPDGFDESDNTEIRRWGDIPGFTFKIKSHVDLGEALDILDFTRAAKLAGARFALYKGAGAALERALISFMLDTHTREHGYLEILPPFMVNTKTMTGTGQLPKFRDDQFKIEGTDYWMIPTAEVPVTNIYAGEILEPGALPLSMTAYTPCFRAEAGSYGKDTTGLIRMHQFNKVELVKLVTPEDGEQALETLTGHAEEILKRLNLPYRVVTLCAGDVGASAVKTYDLEVWVPSQEKYREISSCSWFTDYQARRMNLRFRREKKGKTEFVHTLNGSGLAVGRAVVAIMENFQREDGSIEIPQALRPYMGGLEAIETIRG